MGASYTILKTTHVTCALIAYVLFFTRGVWVITNPQRLKLAWVRIVPHGVDSLLLASAIGLVVVTSQYPGPLAWLNVKIAGLILYIGLGMAAFRFCKSRGSKIVAWVLAQMTFLYIVLVAVTRTPFVL
jgi:uncharacterized membrane protein SirB2